MAKGKNNRMHYQRRSLDYMSLHPHEGKAMKNTPIYLFAYANEL